MKLYHDLKKDLIFTILDQCIQTHRSFAVSELKGLFEIPASSVSYFFEVFAEGLNKIGTGEINPNLYSDSISAFFQIGFVDKSHSKNLSLRNSYMIC
jgi:hypothetical protein